MSDVPTFHWADYVVFVLFLCLSAAMGVFFGWRSRKKANTAEFFMGGGDLHYFPVSLSLTASFLSAIFILGTPAEIYLFGTMYMWLCLSYFIAIPISAHMYIPTFHKLKLTSAYEYFEKRFDRKIRVAGSITFAVMVLMYMAVVLYTPAIAIAQVTGLSMEVSIIVVGVICTFYTALGGMKATVWNDMIQMLVVIGCFLLLISLGTIQLGGISQVLEISRNGSRIDMINFKLDPTLRASFWTQVVGGFFLNMCFYGSSQTIIQKCLTVNKLRNAQIAIWISGFASFLLVIMGGVVGLVMYAYYHDCDPLTMNRVEKSDQLLPLYVMEVFGTLHGLPGLFLAATFSAALSSVSGSLNALAAICLMDFIKPAYENRTGEEMKARTGNIISRCLATFFGLFTIGTSFIADLMGEMVLQFAISIFGMVGGPLTALVTLGLFFPCVNSWGALSGLLVSIIITCWIGIGSIVANIPAETLPLRTDGCPVDNSTTTVFTTITDWLTSFTTELPGDDSEDYLWFYTISHMYYGCIAMVVAIIVALPVSLITGRTKGEDLHPKLVYSCADGCCCCCPEPYRICCRCGVRPYSDSDDDEELSDENLDVPKIVFTQSGEKVPSADIIGIKNLGYIKFDESEKKSEKDEDEILEEVETKLDKGVDEADEIEVKSDQTEDKKNENTELKCGESKEKDQDIENKSQESVHNE